MARSRLIGHIVKGKQITAIRMVRGVVKALPNVADTESFKDPMVEAAVNLGGLAILYKHPGQEAPDYIRVHSIRNGRHVLVPTEN
jgi:hypothetical protein